MDILKKIISIIMLLNMQIVFAEQNTLRPFTSDGCSMFPDGSWQQCCVEHDKKYWIGGTREDRLTADRDLKKCVTENSNNLLGFIVYVGVRKGGKPNIPTSFRWGYGWDKSRNYSPLNETEIEIFHKYVNTNNFHLNSTTALPIEPSQPQKLLSGKCSVGEVTNLALSKFKKISKFEITHIAQVETNTGYRLQVFTDHCIDGYFLIDYDVSFSCTLSETDFLITAAGSCNSDGKFID